MDRVGKKLLSWLLVLLMGLSLLPGGALAALEGPYGTGEAELIFRYVNLSGAGPAHVDDWASGEYCGVQEALKEEYGDEVDVFTPPYVKTRLMVKAMHFNSVGYEPISYFIPESAGGSVHELTLYGVEDVDPADITVTGVTVLGEVERHVYGDEDSQGRDGRLYWYTVPIRVPEEDALMYLYVAGELYATLPLVHIHGTSPVPLFSTMQVYDYEEGAEAGTLRSLTLRVSGFSLPSYPLGYTFQWIADPEAEAANAGDGVASVDAAEVSPEDEYGYRLVRFDFNEDASSEGMLWNSLLFDNACPAYFFGEGDHVEDLGTSEDPYYCFRQDYDDEPGDLFYLGGYVCEVPSPYYCIFKDAAFQQLLDPEEEPGFTLAGETHASPVAAAVTPGSYAGGEMALSLDGGTSWGAWQSAGESLEITLPDYGVYSVSLRFRADGYKPFTCPAVSLDYNDGLAPAPSAGGVLTAAGAEAEKSGDAWILTGKEDSEYTFWASTPADQALEAVFARADDTAVLTRDLAWNAQAARYEVTLARSLAREAAKLSLRVKAGAGGQPGHALTLALKTVEPDFIRAVYTPTLAGEVRKDGAGETCYAVAPGAVISGVFETTVGETLTRQMTLTYTAVDGSTRTAVVPAVSGAAGQASASLVMPDDARQLISLHYELLDAGEPDGSVEYDLSAYRIDARTNLTGLPEAYLGTTFTLRGAGVEKYAVLTEDNYASLPMGDLPSGSYTYEISGASGYLYSGTISVTRGEDAAIPGPFPAFCSLTAKADQEVDAAVKVVYTAPDGTVHTASGALNEPLTQLPAGSAASVSISYDADLYPDFLGVQEGSIDLTLASDEEVTFHFLSASWRTISGWIEDENGLYMSWSNFTVEQEIHRGGASEIYRATCRTGQYGRFSFQAYDGVPAAISMNALFYDKTPIVITENGDLSDQKLVATFQNEYIIPIELTITTPAAVDEKGRPYVDEAGSAGVASVESLASSAMLTVTSLSSQRTYKQDQDYDLMVAGDQLVVRLHPGVHTAGRYLYINLRNTAGTDTFEYAGKQMRYDTLKPRVELDEKGNAVARVHASRVGGEIRATVVEPENEGYVGFIKYNDRYVYGRGELSLSYDKAINDEFIETFMCREEELEETLELLDSRGRSLLNSSIKKRVSFGDNRYVYLGSGWMPSGPIAEETLGAYRLHYEVSLSNTPNYVTVTGILEKRYPEQEDNYVISGVRLYNSLNVRNTSAPMLFNGTEVVQGGMWTNPQYTSEPMAPTPINTFSFELPLSDENAIGAHLVLQLARLRSIDENGQYHYVSMGEQSVYFDQTVSIFDVTMPDTVSLADELDKQGLYGSDENRARWTLRLGVRSFVSDDPAENVVTIWDNGTAIDTFTLKPGAASRYVPRDVRVTDNLNPGVHVIWATREYGGETMSTIPQAFSLIRGTLEEQQVFISDITWVHWNQRNNPAGSMDNMYFRNLADFAGREIWIWPSKVSHFYFKVNNATQDELAGITLNTRVDDPDALRRSVLGDRRSYEAVCTSSDPVTRSSWWKVENVYLGYVCSLSFDYAYKPGVVNSSGDPTEEQRRQAELKALYDANGLGSVPDEMELLGALNNSSAAELRTGLREDYKLLPKGLQDLKLSVADETATSVTLTGSSSGVSDFTLSVSEGAEIDDPNEIWLLMEKEQAEGSQNPEEPASEGWEVYWTEMDTLQGTTIIRMAVLNEKLPDGRYHYVTHRSTYVPSHVADALSGSGSLMEVSNDFTERVDRGKRIYDTTSELFTYGDMANDLYVMRMEKEMTSFMGDSSVGKSFGKECNLISKRAGNTMAVLGALDTAYSYYKGPGGPDGTGLRELLSHVKDEKFRTSIENQIRDYEKMRQDIFNQDMTIKTINSASNFGNLALPYKIAMFVGSLGNSIISGYTKDYNQQVYNTTLLDIQRQLRFENNKKSKAEAEKWLRDKMDRIYGKGAWSEHALEEERKYWVLQEDDYGNFHYVWHESAAGFKRVLDPSGYVFEAVESNRLNGVTATLYYSETRDGDYSVWKDTGETAQSNPLITSEGIGGEAGRYAWMVPNGWWKVRYEMDGYLAAESKPMNVPPIHTTVNVGLLSAQAPKAAVSVGDGEITVLFTKYMQLESLLRLFGGSYEGRSFDASAFAVQFYDASGAAIPGTVTFPDKARNTGYRGDGYGLDVIDSDFFVRTAVFRPAEGTDLTFVTWKLADGMVSYSGVPLAPGSASLFLVRMDAQEGVLSASSLATDETGHVSRLPEPIRDGYVFDGWFTAPAGGTQVTLETVFTADTTLYARWSEETAAPPETVSLLYSVTVSAAEGGAASASADSARAGDVVTLTATPDDGYLFAGWEVTLGEISVTRNSFTMPADRVAVRALFQEDVFTDDEEGSVGGGSSETGGTESGTDAEAPQENPFTDVPEESYYHDAVLWAVSKGITTGTTETTFSPGEPCTRAQMITFLWRAAGSPEPETAECPFTDVDASAYYYKAVLWAVETGVTRGTGATTFSPGDTVTRAQTVTFLYRALGSVTEAVNPFTDVDPGKYYYDAVLWAAETGVTKGTSATTFSGANDCIRAQAVTFLYRAYGNE